jgi:ribulose-phosphate 3-epimerase
VATTPKIAPSILSADFGRLAEEVRAVAEAGADWIHVDVIDVHLMIETPERQVEEFVRAGADGLTIHVEACADVRAALAAIGAAGARRGLAVNPPTPLERVQAYCDVIDLLLVMSVNPGWAGQPFVEGSMEKLAAAAALRRETGARFLIEVDGGIKMHNAAAAAGAGADVLVAGSAVFGSHDYRAAIRGLRGAPPGAAP